MQHVVAVLTAAIQNRRVIQIVYEPGPRIIEPHALGRSTDGNVLLRAYQVEGASSSGEHEHWKLFRIDKVQCAEPTGGTFAGPREGYKRGDRHMKGGIIAEL